MPLPSASQVHAVDVPLSTLSQAIMQDLANLGVSRQVFPIVPVAQQSNRYYVWEER